MAVRADAQTEAALLEILESFCSGFAARDADGVMRLFAPDADVVMVTSEEALLRGPDEMRTFLRRYVRGTATYSWTWNHHDVSAAGAVGWLLAEGTETGAAEGHEEKHPYRMSMGGARLAPTPSFGSSRVRSRGLRGRRARRRCGGVESRSGELPEGSIVVFPLGDDVDLGDEMPPPPQPSDRDAAPSGEDE